MNQPTQLHDSYLEHGAAGVRMLARQHLIQYDAKAVDVRLGADVAIVQQLGRQPRRRALDTIRLLAFVAWLLFGHHIGVVPARGMRQERALHVTFYLS